MAVALWGCTGVLQAKVVLPSVFTDNMVLQQKTDITFYGDATKNKQLTVKTGWNGKEYHTEADGQGKWSLKIPTPAAGGPYEITFSDGKKLQLKNVMIGEVWFCSGQSNMEMPVAGWGKVMNYEQEIAEAAYPAIRLFQVKKNTSLAPLKEVESTLGGWQECSSATVPEFSALAYFYARALWKELNVPIGVIDCTWGGTPAEAWMNHETLRQVMGFREEMDKLERLGFDPNRMEQAYSEERAHWQSLFTEKDKGMENGKLCWTAPSLSEEDWQTISLPGYWEGKGLKDFDGIIWFRRSLEIPAEWAGKPLTLRLGMIDDEDITYFNGVEIARGAGYMTPRTYTIPAKLVKAGKAVLAVRVSDFGGEGGIHGKAEELYVEADGKRISLAGDWKYRIGLSLKGFPPAPVSPIQSSSYPTVLFNAMVKPWTAFPIKGVIWYQGEANVGRSEQYGDLFPALITDWRRQWRSNFPFYFVQLANFMESKKIQPNSEWAALREAQTKALKLDQVGMAVTIDIGLADDIHPKNKQEVGRRLALLALAGSYGKNVSSSAPVFQNYIIKGDKMELDFGQKQDGFKIKDTTLKGFTIAGPDRVFYSAEAMVQNGKIIVSSPKVSVPLAARYGWADNPDCNLYGENGLPVAPFRTDCW
ncbi:sialate O-acetylesterase [Phocaeicola vulgatus]|nr:sialate O-acetylesterase [Phocaeicola vulgatus]MCG0361563.1 9-O-acetylesterase [Phocaeicola vulgatus]